MMKMKMKLVRCVNGDSDNAKTENDDDNDSLPNLNDETLTGANGSL